MSKRTECVARAYAVTVTIPQFLKIEARDDKRSYASGLMGVLTNMGAERIEYNGHFGAAIYYTLPFDTDTPELRDLIEAAIINYARGARL